MLKINSDLQQYTEQDITAMLEGLPLSWQQRITRKKPFDARLRSAVGYTLLKGILQDHFGMTALPDIRIDNYGKPCLEGSPLFFSISHCKAAVACIVEETPVGVDVQDLLTDIGDKLKARITAPLPPDDIDPVTLTALWTQKEASAKLSGKGLRIPLESLPLKEHTVETNIQEQYVLTVAR